ncbi:restriction endonuclease [Desulfocurvus sp. DL9XJH121]
MTIWMNRAGKYGEYEQRFLDDNRIYCTWDYLNTDLSQLVNREGLRSVLSNTYPDAPDGRIIQNSSQIWAFAKDMSIGDWVALPSKTSPVIHVAKIKSGYQYDEQAEDPFYHYREVEWFAMDIPRTSFPQDILYSLGAFSTICKISRNNAEERIKRIVESGGAPDSGILLPSSNGNDESDIQARDLEQFANDSIAALISQKFRGHDLTRLVEAILIAQGFKTYRSPAGPDKGIDILAAAGPLGFDEPRICVQVKSSDTPLDRPVLDQLIGAMHQVGATRGLLVSWGGFKQTYNAEERTQFFNVRLWDSQNILQELFKAYDKLNEDIKSELPLKKIWTVALPEIDQ